MLILAGPDSRFELDIVNYQFPNAELDGWDSEWLQVSGRVESSRGRWNFLDSCLTTFELASLATWLVARQAVGAESRIFFTEPNLSLERVLDSGGGVLRVYFSHEASPPWATSDEKMGDGFIVDIPLESINLQETTQSLTDLCEKFPVRAHPGGG